MECARHPGRQAVATCNLCGKGLCSECAERFAPPLCEACLLSHNRNVAVRFAVELGITLLIAVFLWESLLPVLIGDGSLLMGPQHLLRIRQVARTLFVRH